MAQACLFCPKMSVLGLSTMGEKSNPDTILSFLSFHYLSLSICWIGYNVLLLLRLIKCMKQPCLSMNKIHNNTINQNDTAQVPIIRAVQNVRYQDSDTTFWTEPTELCFTQGGVSHIVSVLMVVWWSNFSFLTAIVSDTISVVS